MNQMNAILTMIHIVAGIHARQQPIDIVIVGTGQTLINKCKHDKLYLITTEQGTNLKLTTTRIFIATSLEINV